VNYKFIVKIRNKNNLISVIINLKNAKSQNLIHSSKGV
jgi:hypothetical protein